MRLNLRRKVNDRVEYRLIRTYMTTNEAIFEEICIHYYLKDMKCSSG